jgi:putative membrane protein
MGFGGFGLLLWFVLLVVIIVAARSFFTGTSGRDSQPSAKEVLKRRLAAGEIDEQEYRRIKKQLDEDG